MMAKSGLSGSSISKSPYLRASPPLPPAAGCIKPHRAAARGWTGKASMSRRTTDLTRQENAAPLRPGLSPFFLRYLIIIFFRRGPEAPAPSWMPMLPSCAGLSCLLWSSVPVGDNLLEWSPAAHSTSGMNGLVARRVQVQERSSGRLPWMLSAPALHVQRACGPTKWDTGWLHTCWQAGATPSTIYGLCYPALCRPVVPASLPGLLFWPRQGLRQQEQ